MSDGKPKVKLPVQSIICEDADPDHIPTWWGERVRLSRVSSYKSIDPIRRAPQRPLLQVPSHWSAEFQHKDLETGHRVRGTHAGREAGMFWSVLFRDSLAREGGLCSTVVGAQSLGTATFSLVELLMTYHLASYCLLLSCRNGWCGGEARASQYPFPLCFSVYQSHVNHFHLQIENNNDDKNKSKFPNRLWGLFYVYFLHHWFNIMPTT